jgi:hypothetical protein
MRLWIIKRRKPYDTKERRKWEERYMNDSIRVLIFVIFTHYKYRFLIWFHLIFNDIKTRLAYKIKNTPT